VHLRTDRLLLRPFELSDVDDVWAFQRLPEVARHMLREPRDRAEAETSVRGMMAEREIVQDGDSLTFAIVLPDTGAETGAETGAVIGEASLLVRSRWHRGGEIGYVLHPDQQGRGLATEAMAELLRLGFVDLGLHRITGKCSARNLASARLLERLGMRREGHLHGTRLVKGEWRDELVYAILAGEWRATRSR
jgi:RimJ/RimL family protein N-acetyltransferase